jgi:putative protease
MPMFHMEHCVFAHMLSNGKDYHDCGRPCEKHKVSLRDRVGVEHPLQADAGCRNTVFNGRSQSIAAYVPKLQSLGVQHFRVELLQENAKETQELLGFYADILSGHADTPRPRTKLKVLDLMGVTPGTMEFE